MYSSHAEEADDVDVVSEGIAEMTGRGFMCRAVGARLAGSVMSAGSRPSPSVELPDAMFPESYYNSHLTRDHPQATHR
jgi:hypothetical protein